MILISKFHYLNLKKGKKDENGVIDCLIDSEINDRIIIEETTITDENNVPKLIISRVQSNTNIVCLNGGQSKAGEKVKLNLSFRQVSQFNSVNQKTTFFLAAVSYGNVSSGNTIQLKVYLIKNGNQEEKEASCVSQSNINVINGGRAQADFICNVEGDADDIEIISSDDISGINDNLENYQKSPKKTDEIIEETKNEDSLSVGKILDYSLSENKNKFPPTLIIDDIESNLCNKYGKLTIKGKFDTDIKEKYDFDLTFSYPSATVKCTISNEKKDITSTISCYTKEEFNGDSQVLIEQMTIKKKYKEILFINSFKKDSSISCGNYESIKYRNKESKNNAKYTFLQVNSFKVDTRTNKPSFNLFINSKTRIPLGTSIIITLFININRNRFILRNLEEVEAQAECKSDKEYDIGNAKLTCETIIDNNNNNIDYSKAVGLNIESQDISGIPENADPAQTDIEISQGIVPDYNNELVLKTEIPLITSKSINGDNCQENGNFEIIGETNDNIKITDNFDLLLSVPKVSSSCGLSSNDKDITIKCFTKDKFELQNVYIERQMIQKNGSTLFILTNIESSKEFSCSISSDYKLDTPVVESNPDGGTTNPNPGESSQQSNSKNIRNKMYNSKSSGLSGGAIAAIIIVCIVAVIAVVIFVSLIKSGKIFGLQNKDQIPENNSSTMNAVMYNP